MNILRRCFSYEVRLDSDIKKAEKTISEIKGVVSAKIDEGKLNYELNEWADEYDILTQSMSIIEALGGELIVGDFGDEIVEAPTEDTLTDSQIINSSETADFNNIDKVDSNEKLDKPNNNDYFYDEDNYSYAEVKKGLKKDLIIRSSEMLVALICFIVGLCLKTSSGTIISAQTILFIVAYAICAYDVFYDVIFSFSKKKYLTSDLVISLTSLVAVLLSYSWQATAIMLIYSVLRCFEKNASEKRKTIFENAFYAGIGYIKTIDGSRKKCDEIIKDDEIVLAHGETLPFDATALNEAVMYDRNTKKNLYFKKDETVLQGLVLQGESEVHFKIENSFNESSLLQKKEKFKQIESDFLPENKKLTKITKIIALSLIFIGILVTFLLPVFSENYKEGLISWGALGVTLCFFAGGFSYLSHIYQVGKNLFIINAENGIIFSNYKAVSDLAKANKFSFDARVFECRKINEVVSVSEYKGKLKNIIETVDKNLSGNAFMVLDGKNVGVYREEIMLSKKLSFKPSNLNNTLYVVIDNECKGFVVYETALQQNSLGAMKELVSLGVKGLKNNFENSLLSNDDRAKIDFVEKTVENEKEVSVGVDSLSLVSFEKDSSITIKEKDIVNLPAVYATAKDSVKTKRFCKIAFFILQPLLLFAAVGLSFLAKEISLLFAIASVGVGLLSQLAAFTNSQKIN